MRLYSLWVIYWIPPNISQSYTHSISQDIRKCSPYLNHLPGIYSHNYEYLLTYLTTSHPIKRSGKKGFSFKSSPNRRARREVEDNFYPGFTCFLPKSTQKRTKSLKYLFSVFNDVYDDFERGPTYTPFPEAVYEMFQNKFGINSLVHVSLIAYS